MAQVRFFTDEDVFGVIAIALRKAGWDGGSTPEATRLGETDDELRLVDLMCQHSNDI